VQWLLNGQPITVEGSERYKLLTEGQQLEIKKSVVADTGRYTCVATNEAGVDDKDFDLDVLGNRH